MDRVDGYRKLSRVLRERIETQRYPAGSLLPSERTLAEEFQVNRRTVRRGIQSLLEEGILSADSTRGHIVKGFSAPAARSLGICFDDSLDQGDQLVHATGSSSLIARGFHRRVQEDGGLTNVSWCDMSSDGMAVKSDSGTLRSFSGVAIWPTIPSTDALLHNLRRIKQELAVVILDRRLPGLESDFVGFDDYQVGELAGEHLAAMGHQSVGFIGWSVPETVHHRLAGFSDGLASHGLHVDEEFLWLTPGDGVPTRWFSRLLRKERPRAVFCANDLIAMGLLIFLKEHGLRIPEDVAIVGAGDSMGGMTELVGLTTIALPHEHVGWEAADILLTRLKGGRANGPLPIERRLPVRLVVRRTCGAGTSSNP